MPTWMMSRFMEVGSDGRIFWRFFRMTGTVAPGKQRVVALKKRTLLIIESPIISVLGGKSGQGDGGFVLPEGDGALSAGAERGEFTC